jgi:hypothetical protein
MSEPPAPNNTESYCLWLAANALATAAVAGLAFAVQQEGIAPAVLFPLCVGAALGGAEVAISRLTRVPGVRIALAATVVWGLLVVVGQDYIGHRRRLRMYDDARAAQDPRVALAMAQEPQMRPTFTAYLVGRVRAQPVWWSLDGGLTSGACACVVALAAKKPRTIPLAA